AQLRPRALCVALEQGYRDNFVWPRAKSMPVQTVGELLLDLMASNGWPGATLWKLKASGIAPTIVGGSHKHGGPDLGPTRARSQWIALGIDGRGIADDVVGAEFQCDGLPRMPVRMVARLKAFLDNWYFVDRRSAAYQQVGT